MVRTPTQEILTQNSEDSLAYRSDIPVVTENNLYQRRTFPQHLLNFSSEKFSHILRIRTVTYILFPPNYYLK